MVELAAILFTLAALGGIALASMHLAEKHVKLWMGLIHGALALPAVVLLFWGAAVRGWPGLLSVALAFFLMAALGGAVLFWHHAVKRPMPKPLILGHGFIAIIGYVVLLIAIIFY